MAKKDTTQKGVSVNDTATDIDNDDLPALSTRDEIMESIAANVRKQREKIAQPEDDHDENSDDDLGIKAEQQNHEESPTIKVDGQTIKVTQEEIDEAGGISALQKEKAAANRLREATLANQRNVNKSKELEEREARLAQREADIAAGSNTNSDRPSTTDADGKKVPSEKARKLTERLLSGEDDEVASVLDEMLAQRNESATSPDVDTAVSKALRKVQWDADLKAGNEKFRTEYAEINDNPRLKKLANDETVKLMAEHPDWGPQQIILESGRIISEEFGTVLKQRRASSEDAERLNQKRTTDQTSSASATQVRKPDAKPLTPAEIVAQMNSSRSVSKL